MIRIAIAFTALSVLSSPDNDKPPPVDGPILFEWLTEAQARQLHGESVTVRIRLDSLPGEYGECTAYDCVSRDVVHRTVWFPGEPEVDVAKPLTVRGRLVVIRHKPRVIGHTAFEGFVEFRLLNAQSDAGSEN